MLNSFLNLTLAYELQELKYLSVYQNLPSPCSSGTCILFHSVLSGYGSDSPIFLFHISLALHKFRFFICRESASKYLLPNLQLCIPGSMTIVNLSSAASRIGCLVLSWKHMLWLLNSCEFRKYIYNALSLILDNNPPSLERLLFSSLSS